MITEQELIGTTVQDMVDACRKNQADIYMAEYFLRMFRLSLKRKEGIAGTFQIKRDIVRMEARHRSLMKDRMRMLESTWKMCRDSGFGREERRIIMQSI